MLRTLLGYQPLLELHPGVKPGPSDYETDAAITSAYEAIWTPAGEFNPASRVCNPVHRTLCQLVVLEDRVGLEPTVFFLLD